MRRPHRPSQAVTLKKEGRQEADMEQVIHIAAAP
jgi:hypothetical protein